MSYLGRVAFRDTPQMDAFGRLRVSMPSPQFDNMSEYGNNTLFWETLTSGTGSVAHRANENAIRLSTGGTANGAKSVRQTKAYHRYQPGRSLNIEQTFVMGAAVTNSFARVGYYDDKNGIFLERSGSTVNIVRRTFVSGSAVDTAVAQSSWNVDKFDGTGISGITLDLTKTQILFIQLQYLGVGRVQVGFVVDGIPYVAHQFLNANAISTVYMSTGCLPVRAEVQNTNVSSGTNTIDMICTSVTSGGEGAEVTQFYKSNGITAITTGTTLVPILSVRAATLLGGTGGGGSITNRGHIQPQSFSLMVASQDHEFQILLNPTLTGASWSAVSTQSLADFDVSATAISAVGTVIDGGYIPSAAGVVRTAQSVSFSRFVPIVYSGLNSVQDIITIAARTRTGAGTALAAMTWQEEY